MKTILPIIFCLIHVIPSNAEEEQPPPIVAHFINSGDFKTWNNQKLPKSISDGVMNLLKQAAGTFSASTMDCRMPDHGPMASLAPKHTVSFTTHSNESASIDLFVFSEDYSVLQVSIDSKPKKYFRSLDKKLINDFSTIMTKKTEIEQDAAGQPATRPESKPEGNQKPQPKSEGALPVAGCQRSTFAHEEKMKSASMAWLKSLPCVLVGPICGWLLFCMYGWAQEATLGLDAVIYYTCLLWAIGLVIHATAYVLFGLPLFRFGYRHPHALIWRTTFAVTVGGILGYGACLAVLTLLRKGGVWGGSISGQDLKSPLIGLIYGMWTAVCALRQKPRSEQIMDANLPSASQPPDNATH